MSGHYLVHDVTGMSYLDVTLVAMLSHMFGPESGWPTQDLIGFTDDLNADYALAGYASGVFPMPLHESGFNGMGWWSPMHRGIIEPDHLRVSHSLKQALRRYTTTIDRDFPQVIRRCADPSRPGGWIDREILATYTELFDHGYLHSIETWDSQDRLVGGLYGVSIAGLFAGESMFHDATFGRDASKVALVRLIDVLTASTDGNNPSSTVLLDVQWLTPHLASLGATEIPRRQYLERLSHALEMPDIQWPKPGSPRRGRVTR